MTFKESADYVLPFGKWKDSCLERVTTNDGDAGLRYLGWLASYLRGREHQDRYSATHEALTRYLENPRIAASVKHAIAAGKETPPR